MMVTQVKTISNPASMRAIMAAHLDSPNDTQFHLGDEIIVSGWVLAQNEEDPLPKVIVECESVEVTTELNVRRQDVISKVLQKNEDKRLYCGFNITLPSFRHVKLYIENLHSRIAWKEITSRDTNIDQKKVDNSLIDLLSKCELALNKENRDTNKFINSCTHSDLAKLLESIFSIIPSSSFIDVVASSEKNSIKNFFDHLKNEESIVEWVSYAASDNTLFVPNPSGKGFAWSTFSVIVDDNVNLLFFESDVEPFIILQHVTFADAVLFPYRRMVVILQHISQPLFFSSVAKALIWVLEHPRDKTIKAKFGGGISGHISPYHSTYDGIAGLKKIDDSHLLCKIPCIYYTTGSCFTNPNELFAKSPTISVVSPAQLRNISFERNEFHFNLGIPFLQVSPKLNFAIEDTMRAAALRKYDGLSASKDCALRIWWGVTGQKRSWVEQEEGSAWILDNLVEEWPGLEVVFDGWTSPIDPQERDLREVSADSAVAERILSLMQLPIISRSVIGMTSLEKIAVGMTCDAFVANYATGSMHISRFALRPGVLHISTVMPKELHIQHRAVTVPASRTRDLLVDGARLDFVSYSIDPADILFLLRSVIETRNV